MFSQNMNDSVHFKVPFPTIAKRYVREALDSVIRNQIGNKLCLTGNLINNINKNYNRKIYKNNQKILPTKIIFKLFTSITNIEVFA